MSRAVLNAILNQMQIWLNEIEREQLIENCSHISAYRRSKREGKRRLQKVEGVV